jgi:3-demethoxyubiquinol 3-hydroxylase
MDPIDRLIGSADAALRTLSGTARAGRQVPSSPATPAPLEPKDRALSAALMRVNHVGEVCAQALYQAQALTARSDALRQQMSAAAQEEVDHLAWTEQRLRELDDRPSLLNPLWYGGAFAIGLLAGRAGDRWSLGFVVETERQVEEHLAGHLSRLPEADRASRAIVERMKDDEAQHARRAEAAGAGALLPPLRWAMRGAAKLITTTAHYL